ncbi:MAG: transcriptional repressor [Bacteroides sp.]|nr:transcriptional repressor [Bacteroides sp.]MDE7471528.1 transcriptional repressor [Paramuribaculum sp.]
MNDNKTKQAAARMLTRYMTQHNMRKTPERYAILEKVFETTDHFFIETLHAMLAEDGYHVSRGTVYNTISLLENAGLVRKRTFGQRTAQYEKIIGATNHHHLVCSRCGKVKEIKDARLDSLLTERRYGTFHPTYTDLYVYGLCGKCAKLEAKPQIRQATKKITNENQ